VKRRRVELADRCSQTIARSPCLGIFFIKFGSYEKGLFGGRQFGATLSMCEDFTLHFERDSLALFSEEGLTWAQRRIQSSRFLTLAVLRTKALTQI